MARVSLALWGVMALGSTACLVTDTPTFIAPKRTPPYLTNLDPPTTHTQNVGILAGTTDTYESPKITFDIQSEDLGQNVIALLYVDLKGLQSSDNPQPVKDWTLDPGTLQSEPRRTSHELDFNNPVRPRGCYAVTVVTSHRFFVVPPRPVDDNDVDTATWFYYVGVKPSDPEFPGLKTCEPLPRPRDAGADARDGSN